MGETPTKQLNHWLTLQSAGSGGPWGCRIESVGVKLPAQLLTTRDLMSKTSHHTHIQLERLTGIHERHVVGPGENSFTLAVGAARDCLAHSQHQAQDIQMLINTSITRSRRPAAGIWPAPHGSRMQAWLRGPPGRLRRGSKPPFPAPPGHELG